MHARHHMCIALIAKGLMFSVTYITDEAMVAKTSNPLSYRGLVCTNIFCHDILVTEVYFNVCTNCPLLLEAYLEMRNLMTSSWSALAA